MRPRRDRGADVQGLPNPAEGTADRGGRARGGSDANALQAAGLPCTNLANGTERNHQPDERVSRDALEGMLEVAIALVEEAARQDDGESGQAATAGQAPDGITGQPPEAIPDQAAIQ
jgi:hypothetical protein